VGSGHPKPKTPECLSGLTPNAQTPPYKGLPMFFLPYGIDKHTHRFAYVTYSLIALNIAVYFWRMLDPAVQPFRLLDPLGFYPSHPTFSAILTSMFAHAYPLPFHLLENMLFLALFGPLIEDALGHLEYIVFYVGSGFAAALLHILVVHAFIPSAGNVPVVGASGAIAGILGMFAVRYYKTNIKVFWAVVLVVIPIWWGKFKISSVWGLGIWLAEECWSGMSGILHNRMGDGVAHWVHIGGMAFGIILAYALHMRFTGSKEYLMEDARTNMRDSASLRAMDNRLTLLGQDPHNPDVHCGLARTYSCEGHTDLAIEHFVQCIELYLDNNQPDQSAAMYRELMRCHPEARLDLAPMFRLARHFADIGAADQALPMLESIARDHPDTPEAEVALMRAGDLYLAQKRDTSNAMRCYDQFLLEYPYSSWRSVVEKSRERCTSA